MTEPKIEEESAPFSLYNDEIIKISHPVKYWCPYSGPKEGTLYISNFRLIFVPKTRNLSINYKSNFKKTQIISTDQDVCFSIHCYLGNISKILKFSVIPNTDNEIPMECIELVCKDVRNIKFVYPYSNNSKNKSMIETLEELAFPIDCGKRFTAFDFKMSIDINGWNVFNIQREFERILTKNDHWLVNQLNCDFEVCVTYPKTFGIPKNYDLKKIKKIANIFINYRVPVLSWVHPKNKTPILRSTSYLENLSPVSMGFLYRYFLSIIESSPLSTTLYLLDCRVKSSTKELNFANISSNILNNNPMECVHLYLGISNILKVRESYIKLHELCYPGIDEVNWIANLEATKWLEHLQSLLNGANVVVDTIVRKHSPVIIMCPEGTDRSTQITSLAMLCLDSYYRTIEGFEVLLEKEWISMGHMFSERNGFCKEESSESGQRIPIFLQFMDAVSLLIRQFPAAFEYNEYYLIEILDLVNSCLYGTFLFDTQKQRDLENVEKTTISIWSVINHNLSMFKNPIYSPKLFQHVICPDVSPPSIKLWTKYFMRYHPLTCRPKNLEQINKILDQKYDNLTKINI